MAIFKTRDYSGADLEKASKQVREKLLEAGAELGPQFQSVGLPLISVSDSTRETFDPAAFKGRFVLNGRLYSGEYQHTPGGPVRLTLIRWGKGADDCGKIVVGKGSDLNSTSIVSYCGVTIGQNVHVEPRVVMMDSPGHPIDRRQPDVLENKRMAPIVICDGAWIGFQATILPGVTIGKNAVVKPGAVVMWDVPEDGIVGGNPAKAMKIYKKYFAGATAE